MTNAIAQATVSLERIKRILDTDDIIKDRADAQTLENAKGTIAFEHVAFSYDPGAPVLKDVNFVVEAGQKLGVVGTTGGGKSTVVGLIPRFYDVDGGRVLIDGVDVMQYTKESLRNQIGFVSAGHRALPGNHQIQHRLRPNGRDRTLKSSKRRSSPTPTNSSVPCRMVTTRWSASAA